VAEPAVGVAAAWAAGVDYSERTGRLYYSYGSILTRLPPTVQVL
jgi:hypothetical protein